MRLSISIQHTADGYLPRLVFENPKLFKIIPAGEACETWKEAWMASKLFRQFRQYQQVAHDQ